MGAGRVPHRLIVMRHAKSEWGEPGLADIDRPLNGRGRKAAKKMGQWLAQELASADRVLCSTAVRTRETLAIVSKEWPIEPARIDYLDGLYLAPADALMERLRRLPEACGEVMLVGHNPGMDELVERLSDRPPPRSESGKLMTTAAVALFACEAPWSELDRGRCTLLDLLRPREIEQD